MPLKKTINAMLPVVATASTTPFL